MIGEGGLRAQRFLVSSAVRGLHAPAALALAVMLGLASSGCAGAAGAARAGEARLPPAAGEETRRAVPLGPGPGGPTEGGRVTVQRFEGDRQGPARAAASAAGRVYELVAHVDLDRGTIAGTMRLTYRHDADRPATTLAFLLAPNRLARPPDLPVEWLDARFPKGFARADLSVRDVRGLRAGQPAGGPAGAGDSPGAREPAVSAGESAGAKEPVAGATGPARDAGGAGRAPVQPVTEGDRTDARDPGGPRGAPGGAGSEGDAEHEARGSEPLAYGIDGERLTVFLPVPLEPGETISLSLAFVTTVPVAEGLVGRLRHTLRVQGGWHPLLAAWDPAGSGAEGRGTGRPGGDGWRFDRLPPPARFDALLTAPPGVTLVSAGERRDTGAAGTSRFEAVGRYLPLAAGRGYRPLTTSVCVRGPDPRADASTPDGEQAPGTGGSEHRADATPPASCRDGSCAPAPAEPAVGWDAGPEGAGPGVRRESTGPAGTSRGSAECDGLAALEAYAFRRDRRRAAAALDVAAAAARVFGERHGLPGRLPPLRFAEAPLAAGLVASAEGVVLFDPQLGKIFPWLRPFHDRQVAFRTYEALWRHHLWARGADPPEWVVEALAAIETGATFERLGRRLPRLERTARFFGFIPIVDEFLYSERIPNRPLYREALESVEDQADLGRLDAPALPGWRIARKLEALVGAEALAAGAVAYAADPLRRGSPVGDSAGVPPDGPNRPPAASAFPGVEFALAVSAAAGRDVTAFVREWVKAPRAVDYGVIVGRSRRVEQGAGRGTAAARATGAGREPAPDSGTVRGPGSPGDAVSGEAPSGHAPSGSTLPMPVRPPGVHGPGSAQDIASVDTPRRDAPSADGRSDRGNGPRGRPTGPSGGSRSNHVASGRAAGEAAAAAGGGGEAPASLYETTIRLRAGPPPEKPPDGLLPEVPAAEAVPVSIRFRGGAETRLVAVGTAGEAWTLRSVQPVKLVEADPEGVTEDRWRADNRVPRRWRYLLTELSASLDIREGELEVSAAGTASLVHGSGPVFGLRIFRDQESSGLSGSVGYGLGEWPPGGRHSIGLTGTYERLNPEFGRTGASQRTINTLAVGYGFDSRFDSRNPLSGLTAGIGLTWSDAVIGSDADYLLAAARATTYVRVAPNQALAFRAEVGETLDGDPPFGKGFLLGGAEGLRAYPKDRFSGKSLSLGSIEYRFPLVRDLDQPVLGLVNARGLSGVIGLEAGQTAADHNPFRLDRYHVGLNVGLRLALQLLGISPSLVAFDIAMPLDGGPDPQAVRLYLSASQTF